jgi:transcriptional regulator with GAF, ATPase, and Fis domain
MPNLLLIGPDAATRAYLDQQMALPPSSVRSCDGAALELPIEPVQGLVVRDVERLTRDRQDQLVEWLSGPGYHTRIVATSGVPLYPMVERGEFSDALYYRINMITLRLDERAARTDSSSAS